MAGTAMHGKRRIQIDWFYLITGILPLVIVTSTNALSTDTQNERNVKINRPLTRRNIKHY